MTRTHSRPPVATLGIVLLATLAHGCSRKGATTAPMAMPPPRVEFEPAIARKVTDQVEITGRVAATDFVEVRPRISGHIREVRFQPGQIVEKDAVLFVIDPRWQEADLARASAQLQAANVHLAVAEKELARAQSLVANRAISAEELEARSGRVQEARATAAAAAAAEATAKLDLEFTMVKAPIRGRVSRPLVTTGNYVSGVAGMTTIMTTLVSVDPVHFYGDLAESTLVRYLPIYSAARQKGEKLPLHLALGDEKIPTREGEVESIDNQIDVKSGTILLRGLFPNADGALVPGLYGRAFLPIGGGRDAVLIQERAISTDQNQKFVLVVAEGDKAEYRQVKLGGTFDGLREVLSGVKAGERVIVAGHAAKVRPGTVVSPELAGQKTMTPTQR